MPSFFSSIKAASYFSSSDIGKTVIYKVSSGFGDSPSARLHFLSNKTVRRIKYSSSIC